MADFHHFGVTVRDIERSYDFYTQVAGMTVWNQEAELDVEAPTTRETQRSERMEFMVFSSDEFDVLTANPGSKFKYVMLQSADRSVVFQLTEYVAQSRNPALMSSYRDTTQKSRRSLRCTGSSSRSRR